MLGGIILGEVLQAALDEVGGVLWMVARGEGLSLCRVCRVLAHLILVVPLAVIERRISLVGWQGVAMGRGRWLSVSGEYTWWGGRGWRWGEGGRRLGSGCWMR